MQGTFESVTLGCALNNTYDPNVTPAQQSGVRLPCTSILYFGYNQSLTSDALVAAKMAALRTAYKC